MGTELLPFEEARARLLRGLGVLASERVTLGGATGRVLARDLVASRPLPGFDYSAMDGYAVSSASLPEAGPFRLVLEGESRAGAEGPPLRAGTASRISTGAAMPFGADAVVMQENVRLEAGAVMFTERPRPGLHVRFAGEDLAKGAAAIAAGTRLQPGALALAAMFGAAELVVARRPRVTIVCTGDELRSPGDPERPASIFESNSAALAALARQAGAEVRVAPLVADEPKVLRQTLREALESTDVLLTVGGVSVGDHDLVRPALEDAGVTLDFWRVAIRPGKPLAVGRAGASLVLGLPGNPASAIVTFTVFGLPLLRALQGDAQPLAPLLPVQIGASRKRSPDRLELTRATLRVEEGRLVAHAHDNQSSGSATSLAHSDGLAFVAAGESPLQAGSLVSFLRWIDA